MINFIKFKKIKYLKSHNGQAMILMVLLIGTLVIGVASFLGLLSIYKLRQATNSYKSAQAVFMADAGREWELYRTLKSSDPDGFPCPDFTSQGTGFATYVVTDGEPEGIMKIISEGVGSFDALRVWEWSWEVATGTPPSYFNAEEGYKCP